MRKTIYQNIFKKLNTILKAKHRLHFLNNCIDLKIVPHTLQVKPPKNETSQKRSLYNNYVNLANSTSLKNLKIAQKDAQTALNNEENSYSDFLKKIIPKFNETEKSNLRKFDNQIR